MSDSYEWANSIVSGSGAIGSVIGAYVACKQFKKAKASASDAESSKEEVKRVKNELLKRVDQNEMAQELPKIKRVVKRLGDFALHRKPPVGLKLSSEIKELNELMDELKLKAKYSQLFKGEVDEISFLCSSQNWDTITIEDRIKKVRNLIDLLGVISRKLDVEVNNHE